MTDFKKTIAFLDDLGIGYIADENSKRLTADESEYEPCMDIILEANEHDKVVGYGGFVCEFQFNTDGALAKVGIWE